MSNAEVCNNEDASFFLSLERELRELSKLRREYALRKNAICFELSKLKNEIRSRRLSQSEYRKICNEQNIMKDDLLSVETAIADVKDDVDHVSYQHDILKLKLLHQGIRIEQIVHTKGIK